MTDRRGTLTTSHNPLSLSLSLSLFLSADFVHFSFLRTTATERVAFFERLFLWLRQRCGFRRPTDGSIGRCELFLFLLLIRCFFVLFCFLFRFFFFLPSSNAAITGRVQTGRRKMAAAASRKMTRAGQSITADLLLLLLLFCCCCSLSFFLLLLLLLPDSPTRFYTRRCSHSMLRRPAQISFFFWLCVVILHRRHLTAG